MAKVGENTEVTLDLKTLGMVAAGVGSMVAMWFSLQSEISLAKELPKPNDPEITRMEFDMKDKMIRNTIKTNQEDVKEIKQSLEKIEDKLYNR